MISPRLFLTRLSLLLAIAALGMPQGEATRRSHKLVPSERVESSNSLIHNPKFHPTAPKDILQFTSGGQVLGFAADAMYVASGAQALRVEFVDSRPSNPVSALAPGGAQRAVPLSQVTYPNLWDGVTLSYDAPGGAVVRSTYRIEPGADAGDIRLRYNAPLVVQEDGSLRVSFTTGTANESAPQAWQERDGKRVPVRIAFAPRGNTELTFAVGEYDRSAPLFIDPTLTWNTFLGSAGNDAGRGLAVDAIGNVYVAGSSTATWGSPVAAYGGGDIDAFVAKLDSNGNLIWNTFLGVGGINQCFGLALDVIGNVYVAGLSTATWGSPVRAFSGGEDAFAAKLDSSGTLIWNTFLGSAGNDEGKGLAVDVIGNVYVVGVSFATWGSPVEAYGGGNLDAFAAKLDSSGNLIWNTFLGGSGTDFGSAVTVDVIGNVYVAGESFASWGSPVRSFNGGIAGFAAKLDSSGTLIWNTFLGSGVNDVSEALAVDGSGNVYVAGFSNATWGSPVRAFSGSGAAFAAKLDSNGNLIWNTFLGGGGINQGFAVALDGSGNIYVAGTSDATWGSPARAFSGGEDAFAAQLDSGGMLTWNTFLGSGSTDVGNALALDGSGNVYVAGTSNATWGDSPVRAYSGGNDAFVAKVPVSSPTPTPTPPPTPTPTPTPIYSAQIQPPINADGTSVFDANRGVVPVKFTLSQDGNPTCVLPPATIAVTRTAGAAAGAINESVYTMPADTGSNFRVAGCQYIYSLNSSALGSGTYRVDIKINGEVVGSAIFQLK